MSIFGGGGKTAAQTPTRAMGIDLQGAQYGAPIPVVFGRNKLAGNVIDYMDFKATAHTQKQGGKGGGGGASSTSYTYSCSYLLGLCEGPASVVRVYDGASATTLSAVGGLGFTGTQGQAPWSHLTGDHALGYSGTALAAFQNKQLGSSASLPNYNFEMDGRNQFGGGIVDANPADIVTAVCTDSQIGVNFTALGDLTAFKNYCTAAGLFFSPVYATQQPASQVLDDLFKYSNCAPFFSEGVLKVVPYGDATITGNGVTYTPNNTAIVDLGRDDFITNGPGDPVTIHRVAPADAMNIQRVEFKDRAHTYHTSTVMASIDQDVVANGSRAEQSDSVDMITTAAVARMVSQNLLQRTYYIRNTYEFQLSWRYCYLEPMDVVTLTDANTGLYLTPVRITEVSEDEHGLLSFVAEEFPDGVSHASTYSTQPNAGTSVDPNADPGAIDGPYLFRGPGFLVSNNQPEIWCAVSGNDPLWAGCDVYISHDGTSYTYLTTASARAAYGVLSNTLASAADPDTTGAPNVLLNGPVQLLGGTQADADQFVTLAMIDNEIVAYKTATLASGPSYTLGYLRRGGYGSAIAAHAANAPFVRLDENIIRIPVDPSQIGQTVYLKFVSFNVFGKGGRTLASETAYQYVIGTNIELPDVPVTPASFTATGVADGVSLTWTNPNPAAVGCTSIEYATASTGPWTVLAQVGPTTTAFPHHFTNGATYFYRARSRGPLVSAGFSAYTATASNAGVNVAAISTAASNANANTPAVVNPQFLAGLNTGWTYDNAAGFYVITNADTPDSAQQCHLGRNGQAGVPACTARNGGYLPVQTGQTVVAAICLKAFSCNSTAAAWARISWRDSKHTELSVTRAPVTCGPGGTYLQCVSKAVGQAPANAQFAHFEIEYSNHTSGYFTATSATMGLQPAHLGEVVDGGGRYGVHQVDTNGLALIDFSQAGHASKNLDNIADGPTYGRVQKGQLQSGVPLPTNTGRSLVPNGSFELNASNTPMGDGWTPGGSYLGIVRAVGVSGAPSNAVLQYNAAPGSVIPTGVTYTDTHSVTNFNVTVGDTVTVSARFTNAGGSLPAGITGVVQVSINFINSSGGLISSATATSPLTAGWPTARGSAQVPVGAVSAQAQVLIYTNNTTGSAYTVPAGSFPFFGYVDNIAAYAVASMDTDVSDGATYGRTAQADLYTSGGVNRVGLRIAGSGHVLGNQLNAPNSLTLNYGAARTATAVTAASTGAVSINAFSVNMGGNTVSYNAVANAVTGLTQGTTYQIYCHDLGGTGGTKTWLAVAGSANALLTLGDDVVLAGQVTIPTGGTSGGGGTGTCVCDDMMIDADTLAGEARVGDLFDCMDIPTQGMRKFRRRLQSVEYATVPCLRITTDAGAMLECSTTTPFDVLDGRTVYAPDMLGEQVVTDKGIETVARVDDIGERRVCHIHLGGVSYAAGADPAHRIYSHNLKP